MGTAHDALTRPQTSFNTLKRQKLFTNPPKDKSAYPELMKATLPHIESFDALFREEDGLLQLACKDIGNVVLFDKKDVTKNGGLGNKMTMHIHDVSCALPEIDRRDKQSLNRKIYPTEARERLVT